MSTINSLLFIGAWISLLTGAGAWAVRIGKPASYAKWLLVLAVVMFYWPLIAQHWFLGPWPVWDFAVTRHEVSAALVPAGLLCFLSKNWWVKGAGALLIIAGFANVFPGLLYPIEGVESGSGQL